MAKLEQTEMLIQLVYIYYNVYLIKKVYFGYGILQINNKQEKILQVIYKEPIVKKLGYSMKIPKRVIYIRRNTLGIGILKPKMIIETLVLKLYVEYKRVKTRIAKLININEVMQFTESGYNLKVISQQKKQQTISTTWTNNISNILNERKLNLINIRIRKD